MVADESAARVEEGAASSPVGDVTGLAASGATASAATVSASLELARE
jgi:hypothetical protein